MTGVLLAGGSGTLGREITRQLHAANPELRIVIYSRSEDKQVAMEREFPAGEATGIRYMLGDILDTDRLCRAMTECDTVIHCAAVKCIDRCEYDAWEAIRINTMGTLSVAKCCVDSKIRRALFISTDKSPDPVGIYGRTKGLGEDLWIHGNNYGHTEFVAVRYGNVLASAKSVFHLWKQQAAEGKPITVTSAEATRFFWTIEDAARFCIRHTLDPVQRGCIYIPKMQSWRMYDIAKSYSDNVQVTGWRCPEKTHEVLWTDWENAQVREQALRYCLYPYTHSWGEQTMVGAPVDRPLTSADALTDKPLPLVGI